jgi:hypothetical protein
MVSYLPILLYSLQMFFKTQNIWENTFLNAIQFATKTQLENLTHMFWPSISFWKLYKKGAFSYVFTIKNMWHLGMNPKKLNFKAKHKMK